MAETAKMPPPYVYRRLNKDRKEIRLLTLQPGSGDDEIRCTLRHTFIDERPFPNYETISYVCGRPEEKRPIKLHGSPVNILANSEIVLRRMRLPASKRVLWLDAVCIDQNNVAERGHQVGVMSEIYTNTFRNLIWLGPDDGHTEQAITEIRAVIEEMTRECNGLENFGLVLRNEDRQPQDPYTGLSSIDLSSRSSLLHFFRSTWFRRLWIVQETLLAPISVLHRGHFEIAILDVLRVAAWIHHKWYALSGDARKMISSHTSDMFALVDGEHGSLWSFAKSPRFLDLLTYLTQFETSNPQDHIFGILGLWQQRCGSNEPVELLNPDYLLDVCTVFTNATRYAIQQNGNLWPLASVNVLDHDFGKWPSWVPRWDHVDDDTTDPAVWRNVFNANYGVITESVYLKIYQARFASVVWS